MKAENFNQMMNALTRMYNESKSLHDYVLAHPSTDEWSLETVKSIRLRAINLQSKEDHWFKDEKYHVEGMAKMSPVQISQFEALNRKILGLRTRVKQLAGINLVKDIPVHYLDPTKTESSYTCKTLGMTFTVSNI